MGNPSTTEEGYVPEKGLAPKLSLQRWKLGRKAKQEPNFRFYTLYDRISREDVLEEALKRVRANRGSAGVDGVRVEDVTASPEAKASFLSQVRKELVESAYRPMAVRRVWIPKANGGKRALGVPTVKDRVVQQACLLILEPIFESDFHDCSYGFRPGRSQHDALNEIRSHLESGFCAVYDADIKSYFDTIDHRLLLRCVKRRVTDRSVLGLIRMWLECPVWEHRDDGSSGYSATTQGTPQGGVISPLLANVFLNELDRRWHSPDGPRAKYNARLVRYADDFVVLARFIGSPLRDFLKFWVETKLKLTLHPEKTRVVDLRQPTVSLDFLGYRFRYDRSRFRRWERYWNMFPSPTRRPVIRDRIRKLTGRRTNKPLLKVVQAVNETLLDWAPYYSHGYPSDEFRRLDEFVRKRFFRFMRTRSQRRFRMPEGVTLYAFLESQGLVRLGSSQVIARLKGLPASTEAHE
jgi:RNA-directed DNA polymerase